MKSVICNFSNSSKDQSNKTVFLLFSLPGLDVFRELCGTKATDIGVLFNCGITATNSRSIEDSDLGVEGARKAFVVDMQVGRFDFVLIVFHFKSGRKANEQATRGQRTIFPHSPDRPSEFAGWVCH